jgi:hypothetical protein
MKRLFLKSKKLNLLFSFTEKKQVKKNTFCISTKVIICFFVVLSLTHFAKVNAQCNTVICSALPKNTVATVTAIAGNDTATYTNSTRTVASFSFPIGITINASSNIFVPDLGNNLIHKLRQKG